MPRLRRLQFGLRSLMLAVTLLCVVGGGLGIYVRNEIDVVHARKAFLENPQYGLGESMVIEGMWWPGIRRMLGDKPLRLIRLPIGIDKATYRRIATLFPEAKIEAYRPPYPMTVSRGTFFSFPDGYSAPGAAAH